MGTLRVAAIQLCSGQDRERNLARVDVLVREAAAGGARLVALPENVSYLGSERGKLALAELESRGPTVELLASLAAELGVVLVGGSVPLATADPERVTNTCLVFDAHGKRLARYDKLHLFDVELDAGQPLRESSAVAPGRDPVVFEACGHTLGLSICYDLRFPELYRELARRGAQVLFVPSAFTVPTGRAHWELLLRARAVENLAFVVAPAQWGEHGAGRSSHGHSLVVGPWGDVLAELAEGEGVLLAELDFARLDDARRRLPALEHRRLGLGLDPR